MPAYEICYLAEDGALVCAFTVRFESAMRAKILAHAMRPAECHRMEVWHGKDLVYRRPELDAGAVLPHTPMDGAGNLAVPA